MEELEIVFDPLPGNALSRFVTGRLASYRGDRSFELVPGGILPEERAGGVVGRPPR